MVNFTKIKSPLAGYADVTDLMSTDVSQSITMDDLRNLVL